jgi:hypothetical protein
VSYYLAQHGAKDAYDCWSSQQKREFLLAQVALKIQEGKIKSDLQTVRQITVSSETDNDWAWMSKQEMINLWGTEKAEAKINSGKLATQADPDTGEWGEWLTEYKIHRKKGTTKETDNTSSSITGTQEDLDKDAAEAALKNFAESAKHFALEGRDPTEAPSSGLHLKRL